MANSADIQSEMSTKIKVDQVQAANDVENLTNKFKDLTAAWKAEQAVAKAQGNDVEAAKIKYEGLSQTLEVQKDKVEKLKTQREALKREMADAAVVTKEQTESLKSLDSQLTSAANKVNSLSRQQSSARRSYEYMSSGLKELRNEYYSNGRAIDANVKKLEAQGHTAEAQKARLSGLKSSLENLTKQESAAKTLADETAKSEGKNSTVYLRRKADLDKTSASIAKTKDQIKSLEATLSSNTGWSKFKRDLTGVSGAEKQVSDNGHRIRDIFTGAFLSNLATSALTSLQSHLTSIIKTGYQVALAGREIQARWSNLGVSAEGVKKLTTQMADLKANSNMSADSVTALQMRFYDLTGHSIPQTMRLTKGVASLTDTLHLSEGQTRSFTRTLTRVESAGKVTQQSLGRIERAAPGFSTALQRASGMSRKSFDSLIQSGKMTSAQFNDILGKASKDYEKNARYFNNTYDGAMHHLTQTWKSTQRTIARPLMNVATAGLQSLDKVLSNKNIQNALNQIAEAVAHAADGASKLLTTQNITGVAEITLSLVKIAKIMAMTVWRTFSGILTDVAKALHLTKENGKDAQSGLKTLGDAMEGVAKHQKAIEGITKALIALWTIKKATSLINGLNEFRKEIIQAAHHVRVLGADIKTLPHDTKVHIQANYRSAVNGIKRVGRAIKTAPKRMVINAKAQVAAAKRSITNLGRSATRVSRKGLKFTAKVSTTVAKASIRGVGTAAQATARTSKIAFQSIGRSAKALSTTIKTAFMTNPFGILITAIGALVTAFQWLYDNDRPFRKWVDGIKNGLIKTLNSAFRNTVKSVEKFDKGFMAGLRGIINFFKKDWKQIALFLVNPIAGGIAELYKHNKKFRSFCNGLKKTASSALRKTGKSFQSTFRNIGKTIDKYNKDQVKKNRQAAKNWEKFTRTTGKTIQKFWKNSQKQATSYWKNREKQDRREFKTAQKGWINLGRFVSRTSKNMWKQANNDSKRAWVFIRRWGNQGSRNVSKDWTWLSRQTNRTAKRMFKNHQATFRAGYKVIEDRTRTWRDLTSGHWDRLADDTRRTAQDMRRYHERIFRDMYDKLNDMTGGRLGDMLKIWQNIFGSIKDAVGNAIGAVHRKFVDLVGGVLRPFKTLIDDIKNGINWVLDKLGATKLGGDFSITMPSYATGTDDTHPGGFAKVNDGNSPHYRELYQLPTGQIGMFPAIRNMVLPLPKGTSVLDGERSYMFMRMMGRIPHYADGIGALSDMFSNIVNSAGDALDGMMEDVDKIMDHPIEFMESVFKKFVKVSTPIKFAGSLVTAVPKYIAKQMGEWIKKQFATLTNPGGAGVERWRPYIIRAFKQLGYEPAAWKVAKLLRQIQTESGGDPHAFQHGYVDANTGGNEARGLLQFAGSTWRADALPGHTDWRNGYNEILAAIKALEEGKEGGWGNVGNGHGWANGGLVSTHGLYEVAENNKPEFIIPTDITKRGRAYQLLGEVMTRFKQDDPRIGGSVAANDELHSVEKRLDQVVGLLAQILDASNGQIEAVKAQGTFDTKSFYKKQARDAAMRAYS